MNKIYVHILELCSESEYGSWEFWLKDLKDRTMEDARLTVQAITDLAKEKKIYPMEYASVKDRSYKEATLDTNRLREEVVSSIDPDNIGNTKTYYWFLATEDGKKADAAIRSEKGN